MKPILDLSLASELPCGPFQDRTEHSQGALRRPVREEPCRALVFHRIGEPQVQPTPEETAQLPGGVLPGGEGRDIDGIIRFFTSHPEGVATVTLDGSYDDKKATIDKWSRDGVPDSYRDKSFVPYSIVIEPDGAVHQLLRLDVAGAHARGFNHSGIGVAFIGDFRFESPTDEQLASGLAVCVALLRQLGLSSSSVKLYSHDEARALIGQGKKECVGKHFPLDAFRQQIREHRSTPERG
ncbi:MAG: N-acetylmuramoyl-L-alanine amidase [Myxococcales bacterium]|nr:N-acetylmuramoyl-L-alanine amidase [Myxococcales bacterium]